MITVCFTCICAVEIGRRDECEATCRQLAKDLLSGRNRAHAPQPKQLIWVYSGRAIASSPMPRAHQQSNMPKIVLRSVILAIESQQTAVYVYICTKMGRA